MTRTLFTWLVTLALVLNGVERSRILRDGDRGCPQTCCCSAPADAAASDCCAGTQEDAPVSRACDCGRQREPGPAPAPAPQGPRLPDFAPQDLAPALALVAVDTGDALARAVHAAATPRAPERSLCVTLRTFRI